jgi:hypothetical protein
MYRTFICKSPIIALFLHFVVMCIVLIMTIQAFAQNEDRRARDIKTILEKISGPDPIEGAVATDEALKSEDPILRSLVLEKALQSQDTRIRETGFRYIFENIQEFTVFLSVSDKNTEDINNADKAMGDSSNRGREIINHKTMSCKINQIDKFGNGTGTCNRIGDIKGVVGSGNLTITFPQVPNWDNCTLQFRDFDSGYLNGSLNCSSFSYAAKLILP